MGIVDARAGSKRDATMNSTWGHLKPKKKFFKGTITAYHTEYRVSGIFSTKIEGLGDSPWWYDAMTEFTCSDQYNAIVDDAEGSIIELKVHIWAKKDNTFTIKIVGHKYLIGGK